MKLKLSAEQKTVKLLWVAYLNCLFKFGGLFKFSKVRPRSDQQIIRKIIQSFISS